MAERAQPAPFLSAGPVETAVRRLLPDGVDLAVAPRSPLGSRALRAAVGDPARCRDLAAWLEAQPWVEAVAARPPNVYLTVPTAALRDHVVAGLGPDAGRGDEGAGHVATVRTVDAGGPAVRLADLRAAAVAGAAGRLLAARGFAVGEGGDRVVHVLPRDRPAPGDGAEVAAVGLVDVPNGPLRARHGGVVWAGDLAGELSAVAADGEALLRYLLLRSERTAHITLEERRLFGEGAKAWAALVAVPGVAAGAGGAGGAVPERALRPLLLHLDALPAAVARSASVVDPVHLVRWADGLAERVAACGDHLAADAPVSGAVTTGLQRAAALAGLAGLAGLAR